MFKTHRKYKNVTQKLSKNIWWERKSLHLESTHGVDFIIALRETLSIAKVLLNDISYNVNHTNGVIFIARIINNVSGIEYAYIAHVVAAKCCA